METFVSTRKKIKADRRARLRRGAVIAASGVIGAYVGWVLGLGNPDDVVFNTLRIGFMAGVGVIAALGIQESESDHTDDTR